MGVMQVQRNLLPDIRDMLQLSFNADEASSWMTSQIDELNALPLQAITAGRYREVYELVLALNPQM